MYRFLGWCLKLERGKEGRWLKRINKASSLEADWKNFRGYYQKLTKTKINDENGSEVRRVSRKNRTPFDLLDSLL